MKFGCYDIQSGGVRRQEKFALSLVGMKLVKTRCCFSPIFYRAQMQHWHLNDAAALHHDDFVGLLDCRKPVRYHDCSPPPPTASPVSDELIQRLLHHLFAVRVQRLPNSCTNSGVAKCAETELSKCKKKANLSTREWRAKKAKGDRGVGGGESVRTEVASSSSSTGGSRRMARAMATRCFCPPDSWLPREPQCVAYLPAYAQQWVSIRTQLCFFRRMQHRLCHDTLRQQSETEQRISWQTANWSHSESDNLHNAQ